MWPLGPSPFISIDTYNYYRTLAQSDSQPDLPKNIDKRIDPIGTLEPLSSIGLIRSRLAWLFRGRYRPPSR